MLHRLCGFLRQTGSRNRNGVFDVGLAMRWSGSFRDRLLRDPLFLIASVAYALNRWVIKPHTHSAFLNGYFDDLWLIPAALPPVLWMQACLGWRLDHGPPSGREIGYHLVIWTVICEGIGPSWLGRGTADLWDVAAYAVGAFAAYCWWNCNRFKT